MFNIYLKLRFHSLVKLIINKPIPFSFRRVLIKSIPRGHYCYSITLDKDDNVKRQYNCPFMYHNQIDFYDCGLYTPKWMFWKWNGLRDTDIAIDDQCKMCSFNNN